MAGKSTSKQEKGKALPKTDKTSEEVSAGKKRGWDEIESLFDDKKKKKADDAAAAKKAESAKKAFKKASKSGKAKAEELGGDWVDDGLGGVYNSEGFTGRVEDGVRVFKAHVIQQSADAGQTDLCPFDCKCCYM